MWTRRTGCRRGSSKSGVVQRGGRSETQAVAVSTNPDAALVALMYACRCRLQLQARHRLAPVPPRDGTRSKDSPTPPPLACLACSYSSAIVLIFGPLCGNVDAIIFADQLNCKPIVALSLRFLGNLRSRERMQAA